ncbi:MAG: glycosyltransferase family 39 protein [Candidatus Krumholzibacteria bacterium]|nr:glycosyltransferase family 39 protein [Candidatus Krumholzibacteria bacterium]
MRSDEHRRRMLILSGIVIIAAVLRFYRLGHQSFWIDEILTAGSYVSPPPGISYWRKLLWDMHGPLYSLVMHFWSMARSSETWLRTPGAVAGVGSVILMYRWMSSITDSRTALTGAFLLAVSPFHIFYSQEMRFYSVLVLFIILSLITFKRFLDDPSRKNGVILGVTLGLTCLSHFMALFLCGGFLVYIALSGRLRGKWLRPGLLAALITLIMVSPWVYREIYFLRNIDVVSISSLPDEARLRGELTLNRWSYPYAFYAFSTGFSFGPDLNQLHRISSGTELLKSQGWWIIPAGIVFFLLTVAGLYRSRRERLLGLFLSISLTTFVLVTVAALMNIKVFNVRYLICFFPLYIATLALGIQNRRVWAPPAFAAVVLIMLYSNWNYHMVDRYSRDDFRSAADMITANADAGDLVILSCGRDVFEYYCKKKIDVVEYSPLFIGNEETRVRIESQLSSYSRVWYLGSREWEVDPDGVFMKTLSSVSEEGRIWEFTGVRLVMVKGGD